MNKIINKKTLLSLLLTFSIISLAYFFPLYDFSKMRLLLIHGDDLVFHFMRVFSMIDQIEYTGLPRAVGEYSLNRYAYGVNLFYPYLTSVLPIALLSMITDSLFKGYYWYLFFLNIVTLFVSFFSMKYLTSIRKLGLIGYYYQYAPFIFSILYTFSQYRSMNLLKRTALGEGVAMTFLPLVLAGFISIVMDKGRKKKWLIFGMAGLAYTHYITLLLVSIFLALGVLFSWKRWDSRMWGQLVSCTLFSLMLSAFSLLPLFEQSLNMSVRGADAYKLSQTAYLGKLSNVLSFGLEENDNYYTLGSLHILGSLMCIGLLFKKDEANPLRKGPMLLIFVLSTIAYFATTPMFPWKALEDTFVRAIQFPFRILSIVTLLTSFLITIGFSYLCSMFMKQKIYQFILIILLVFGAHTYAYKNYIENIGDTYTAKTDLLAESLFEMTNVDYIGRKTDAGRYLNKIGNVNGIDRVFPYKMRGNEVTVDLSEIPEGSQVDLPLLAYKGIDPRTADDEKIPFKIKKGETIRLKKEDIGGKIYITYKSTLLAKFAWLMSVSTLIVIIFSDRKDFVNKSFQILNILKKKLAELLNKGLQVRVEKRN